MDGFYQIVTYLNRCRRFDITFEVLQFPRRHLTLSYAATLELICFVLAKRISTKRSNGKVVGMSALLNFI